ncbi:MAG TPA: PBP1A family penicillin-binding protein [bacterium]|nr:PBP1A family penicillin-binding protein [bacterium]
MKRYRYLTEKKPAKIILWTLAALFIVGIVGLFAGYRYLKGQIPRIETIADYKPVQGTKIYSYDGQLVAEFYQDNRRNIVPYDKIPRLLSLAFVAGEDGEFFKHSGVDPVAMMRAALKYAFTGVKQGGSTITQQLAKAFVGSERTMTRKLKDMLLAMELERALTKEEILYLYLNEIFLGSGAYGVESAALTYFSKHVWELDLAEMATLAGLPKYPSEASPKNNPEKAKKRRDYVLGRMFAEKYITKEQYDEAHATPMFVTPMKDYFLDKAPYFSEKVRRHLQTTYGNDQLYQQGLVVSTTVDVRASQMMDEAVYTGLRALARRQGYTGPLYRIDLKKELDRYLAKHRKFFGEILPETMVRGVIYQGVVLSAEKDKALIQVGEVKKPLYLKHLQWARPYNPLGGWAAITSTAQVLKPGDIIIVRPTDTDGASDDFDHRRFDKPLPTDFFFALEQIPVPQGAAIVKDPYSGYIRAVMGGYDFEQSEFDRTSQACRQPGSAMKPVFYAGALEQKDEEKKLKFTPATMLLDAPVAVTDMNFKPENHDETFKGEVTLWEAIVQSMNAPAVRMFMDIGIPYGLDFAKKLGIKSVLRPEFGTVLGASCLTLDELTDAYSHFPNQGKKPHTTYIRKVVDRNGALLENNTVFYDPYLSAAEKIERMLFFAKRPEEQNMSPQSAYIMTRILQDVTIFGTGAQAAVLGRNIGGKTGTTNDSFDAWFIGFSPEFIAGVWLGNDQHGITLGPSESGSKAALPIWIDFMGRYLANFPKTDFRRPPGIVSVQIDRKTGLVSETGRMMHFVAGTEPTTTVEEKDVVDPTLMKVQ